METEQPSTSIRNQAAPGQAAIKVMAALIQSLPEGRERGYATEACLALAWRLWGWNVERFRDELAKSAMVQNTIDRSGAYSNPID